ncbi:MAG: TatD family hydrolase [Nanoarchaeota archaeon]|nr:TatD family hydrolase [Nanoarchaeota archaeon]
MLIDVHTHLTYDSFDKDREEVIKRSKCSVMINNGLNVEDNRATLKLAKKYKEVKVALGLYPSKIVEMKVDDIKNEIEFISKQDIVGVGEIGMDGTYPNIEKQEKWFRELVKMAMKNDVPVIVHSRKAEKLVIDILEEMKVKKVVLHMFSGKLKLVERAEKLGFYFSIPVILGHSRHFQELVKKVSITKLLTETDAPYLGPVKGERNEPMNVKFTVEKIAELKGMDKKEVENSVYMNYQRLFS